MTAVLERVREDVVALAPPEPTIHWQQRVWRRATVHTLAHGGYPRFRLLLLGCYAFFLPVQIALGPTRLAFSDPFILLYLGLYGLGVRKAKGAWSSWYPALLAVMNFGIFVALVRTGSVTSYALIQKAAGLAFLMVTVAALVDFMRTAPRARWLLTVFVKGVVVNSVIAVAAYGIQKADQSALGFINYEGVRLSGFAIDPNAYGGLIDCALMLHLFTARSSHPLLTKWWRLVATVILPLALVLTFSRSAWIGAVFGITVAILVAGRSARRAIMPLMLTFAVAVPLLAAAFLPDLTRLAKRPDQVGERVSIISDALADFALSPIFGTGLGTFDEKHGLIIHNTVIWFLAEFGLLGLLVFTGFITSFAARMIRFYREGTNSMRALAVGLLAAHAAMLGVAAGIEALYQRQWWLVFAVGAALGAIPRHERR